VQQFPTANYHCSTELLSAKCWRFLGNSYCIDKRNAEAKNAYTHAYRLLLRAKDGASTIAPELIATAFGLEQLHDPAAKIVREKAKTLVGVEAYNQLLKH